MDARVSEDMGRYREALEETGGVLGGVEPISRFHEAFHGPVDAAYAAAVVGLETETFLEKVRENTGLQNVGLLALEGENGSVKRDTWTSSFRDVIYALDYPQQVGDSSGYNAAGCDTWRAGPYPGPATCVLPLRKRLAKAPMPRLPWKTWKGLTFLSKIDAFGKGIRDLTGHSVCDKSEPSIVD